MINRFEKSHGRNVEMAVPSTTSTHQQKPPLMKTLRAPAKPVAPPVPPLPKESNNGMWQNMIQRTMDRGEDVKRGQYALSSQRKQEMVDSYRTLNPNLQ